MQKGSSSSSNRNKLARWHDVHRKRQFRKKISAKAIAKNTIPIHVPPNICLKQDHKRFSIFLHDIQKAIDANQRIFFNFSKCEYVTLEACLVVAALIKSKSTPITHIANNALDKSVQFFLRSFGFFRFCRIRSTGIKNGFANDKDSYVQKIITGNEARAETRYKALENIFSSSNISPEFHKRLLDTSLRVTNEAISNCMRHAYKNKDTKSWWMSGLRDPDRHVFLIYDKGVGIPQTVPVKWPEQFSLLFKGKDHPKDADIIELSTEVRRTSSDNKGSGLGMKDLKDMINYFAEEGALKIYSGSGLYIYRKENKNVEVEKIKLGYQLPGTLVYWEIRNLRKSI